MPCLKFIYLRSPKNILDSLDLSFMLIFSYFYVTVDLGPNPLACCSSMLESTNQISQVTNFSLSNWTILAKSQILI